MINYKESKEVRMDSWLLKLLSREKNKNKKQRSTKKNHKKNNRKIKYSTK